MARRISSIVFRYRGTGSSGAFFMKAFFALYSATTVGWPSILKYSYPHLERVVKRPVKYLADSGAEGSTRKRPSQLSDALAPSGLSRNTPAFFLTTSSLL